MFCQNCGKELPDGTVFCPSCGARQETKGKAPKSGSSENLKMILGLAGGVLAVLIILILLIVTVYNKGRKVDLNKYVSVTFEGYDTQGRAAVNFDQDSFRRKYGRKIRLDLEDEELKEILSPVELFAETVYESCSLDKEEALKNGDTVSLTWDFDSKKIKEIFGLKVKAKEKTFEVENLEEIEFFDPFQDVEVVFSGTGPNGRANLAEYPSDNGLYYDIQYEGNGLSNGDTVNVVISYPCGSQEAYVNEYGKLPAETSREFKVEGLDEYITGYKEIEDALLEDMKKTAEEKVRAYSSRSYDRDVTVSDLEYAGYIFGSLKPEIDFGVTYNEITVIYKGLVSHAEGEFEPTQVYYPVQFTNILKTKDGMNYDEGLSIGISGLSIFENSYYTTEGYINPVYLYAETVQNIKDTHEIEAGDGFEVYSRYALPESCEDISEACLKSIEEAARKQIEYYIENSDFHDSAFADLEMKGYYLMNAKEERNDILNRNRMIVVFESKVSSTKGKFDDTVFYFPVLYKGVTCLQDEMMSAYTEGIKGVSAVAEGGSDYVRGYADGETMFKELVESNCDTFDYAVSEGLKEFGE